MKIKLCVLINLVYTDSSHWTRFVSFSDTAAAVKTATLDYTTLTCSILTLSLNTEERTLYNVHIWWLLYTGSANRPGKACQSDIETSTVNFICKTAIQWNCIFPKK